MARYHIISVLKRAKNDPLLLAADDYINRLNHYRPSQFHVVKPSNIKEEEENILALLPPKGLLVALDERGKELTSLALSQKCARWELDGYNDLTFVIGGAFGLGKEITEKANFVWSLGQLTLPHRLALVTLSEQLYRAQTILRHEPYHHE